MAAEESKRSKAVPPYVPFKTFFNFIESLKVGVPHRIDRSILASLSGAMQGQLMSALRYLKLVSEQGLPSERLTNVVNSEGEERKKVLREILEHGYPYLFRGEISIKTATTKMLEEQFANQGASGDTLRKCIAFFLAAAKVADLPISPHIKASLQTRTNGGRVRRSKGNLQADRETKEETIDQPLGQSETLSWSQMLLSKFPSFDPAWPDEVKAKWFEAFERLMKTGEE